MTKTTDLITNTTPSISSGATAFLTNIGELQGRGFELTLGGTVIQAKNISWDLSVNYTTNETTVLYRSRKVLMKSFCPEPAHGVFMP